ncbi:MAG: radical SAM protein, partial [Phycisphaerae bacterium]
EIVVTGIYLGAFGQNTTKRKHWPNEKNPKLAELLRELAKISGLSRIRLSSLEPSDVTEQLLEVICENPNIMPHLHLSLQSGSDKILKRMCRNYTAGEYLETVNLIKDKLQNPSITTDIIVGFPGETDDDFQQSLNLAKQAGFSRIHVFSFSPRKATAAAKMANKVKPEIIKQRAKILGELAKKLAYQYCQQFIGRTAEILIEKIEDGTALGHAERYFEVQIAKIPSYINRNDIIKVTLTTNSKSFMTGRLT